MIESMEDLIAGQPLFSGLPGDVAATAAGCARNVTFGTGRLLLAEGDEATTLLLLRRGRVAIEVHGGDRKTMVVETVGPGQVVGWSWMVPPHTWSFDARALEPVGAIAVDAACLRAKAEADPAFGYELLGRISQALLQRLQATRLRLLDLYGDVDAG
ncbi:MAG TPA: cyclic nucleotide-binding domain-containing protein [Acidimicrobiales bacterium]